MTMPAHAADGTALDITDSLVDGRKDTVHALTAGGGIVAIRSVTPDDAAAITELIAQALRREPAAAVLRPAEPQDNQRRGRTAVPARIRPARQRSRPRGGRARRCRLRRTARRADRSRVRPVRGGLTPWPRHRHPAAGAPGRPLRPARRHRSGRRGAARQHRHVAGRPEHLLTHPRSPGPRHRGRHAADHGRAGRPDRGRARPYGRARLAARPAQPVVGGGDRCRTPARRCRTGDTGGHCRAGRTGGRGTGRQRQSRCTRGRGAQRRFRRSRPGRPGAAGRAGTAGAAPRPPLSQCGLSAGKRARLHRILYQHGLGNGTALFLPYDQGLDHGPRDFFADPAATDPRYIIKLALEGDFNGIAIQVGLAEKFYWDYAGEVPLATPSTSARPPRPSTAPNFTRSGATRNASACR
jgi:hypothetical protein